MWTAQDTYLSSQMRCNIGIILSTVTTGTTAIRDSDQVKHRAGLQKVDLIETAGTRSYGHKMANYIFEGESLHQKGYIRGFLICPLLWS